MQDATLLWGGDLVAGPTGDIGLSSGIDLGQQRVLRRLLTNLQDYIWQPLYGAGLGGLVGQPVAPNGIRALIRSQIFREAVVARLPEPVIDVQSPNDGSIYLHLRYVDAETADTGTLNFSIGA